MTIAFTICSNNYLAHAKTLADSFLANQRETNTKFIIGLVDKLNPNFDYSFFKDVEIIPVSNLNIADFDSLVAKFNITELNTTVKPSYFHYIFKKFGAQMVLYIDPDILITSPLIEVLDILEDKNIVITPHILSPIDDDYAPTDYHTLRGGIFNLGFIGLSDYPKVIDFLDWWHERVIKYGFGNHEKNMFYDQLWINYVPCFYDNYHILKHPGYNVANWNFHERQLSKPGINYMVNNEFSLRFFHFSSYNFKKPDLIGKYATRFNFVSRPDLQKIYSEYQELLINNNIESISKLPVFYYPLLNKHIPAKKAHPFQRIIGRLKKALRVLING
jgi:hypothetical protein